MKKIVMVLGMHRSGTSLTAMLIAKMGLYFGKKEEMIKPDKNNKKGHYEYAEMVQLNEIILYENNSPWFLVQRPQYIYVTQRNADIKHMLDQLVYKSGEKNIMIKDPRLCLLEPLYRKNLDNTFIEERIVIAFRHPFEVAASIEERDGFDFSYALTIWLYYNYQIMKNVADITDERILVVNHGRYFEDGEKQIQQIADFIETDANVCLIDEKIDLSLRHQKKEDIYHNISSDLEYIVQSMYEDMLLWERTQKKLPTENLKKYEVFLEKKVDSFFRGRTDYTPMSELIGHKNIWVRPWCLYRVVQNADQTKEMLSYVLKKEHGINEVALFGDGRIAKFLIDILQELEIRVTDIYVSREVSDTYFGDESDIPLVCVKNIELDRKEYIINTVVNEENEIYRLLCSKIEPQYYISIVTMLYESSVCQ